LNHGLLLAGAARAILRRAVEPARTLVAATAAAVALVPAGAEGLVAAFSARPKRLVPGAAGAERLVASLWAGTERLLVAALGTARPVVAVTAAERPVASLGPRAEGLVPIAAAEGLVSGVAGLARAVVVATGPEGALAAFAGLAGAVAGRWVATVGASRRTAPAIIVVAVGHGSLIAEVLKRSEGQGNQVSHGQRRSQPA
jgi:hypothetical protein